MNHTPLIYYSELHVGEEVALVAASISGLLYAGGFNEDINDLTRWLNRHFPTYQIEKNDVKLASYVQQFEAFFLGKRTTFDFPLELKGTTFQKQVWEKLRQIPFGETTSYTAIAEAIGNPKSVRAVGNAVGKNPILIVVPCHRVVQKSGKLGGFRGGIDWKCKLLHLEKRESL